MKTLYFEGAGWSGAGTSKATVGNCRIRTAFHLDDGQKMYLELTGSNNAKRWNEEKRKYEKPSWKYTGYVMECFYITDEIPNDDENKHPLERSKTPFWFEYSEEGILALVNSLGASFDAVKVVPDLGGYRVFPEHRNGRGADSYNYGDEFHYDSEMISRREAVNKTIYDLEKAELEKDRVERAKKFVHSPMGQDYPNYSLWVDEENAGMLHLLRHFSGYNKHWTIRTDVGETLEDWMSTMQETKLGYCGC
jgi:hypothetical protein